MTARMMSRRFVGPRDGDSALLGVVLLAVTSFVACAPAASKPVPVEPAAAAVPAAPVEPATYLVIRLQARRLDLMKDDAPAPLASFPIAVGRPGHETPTGRYQVEEMIEHPDFHRFDPKDRARAPERIPPGPANPLGERWIGFIRGEGWTIGIHGTPKPQLLGRAVSGGCIRMRNADVIQVFDQVRVGTPVVVHP